MSQMLHEVQEAPAKVQELLGLDVDLYASLGERLRQMNPALVATVARGSSDHAATYGSYLIPLCTGRPVSSVPPSLVTVLGAPLNLKGQLALAISQGGGSPDIIQTLERLGASGALTAALVNSENSDLARTAQLVLPQRAGPEKAVAATKSVLCSLIAIARLSAAWAQDEALTQALQRLPPTLEKAVETGLAVDARLLQGVSNVYTLSRGLGFASALELALKLKETCGLHAEAFSSAEVRHGPREIVDKSFLVIALALPGSGLEDTIAAAQELESQGARVLLLAPAEVGGTFRLPALDDFRLGPIVALQLLYPWIARVSEALGRNPDQMKTLKSKIIKTI